MAGGEGSTWGLGEAAAVAAAGEREAARALSPSARRRRTGYGRGRRLFATLNGPSWAGNLPSPDALEAHTSWAGMGSKPVTLGPNLVHL